MPRTLWPLTGGRLAAAHPGLDPARPEGRTATPDGPSAPDGDGIGVRGATPPMRDAHGARAMVRVRARAISTARLSASPRLHLPPIDQVVYLGPYRKEN